jgi:cytochrome P450
MTVIALSHNTDSF